MKRFLLQFAALALVATAWCAPQPAPRLLEKAGVLPLSLDDAFQFRKTKTFLNDLDEIKRPSSQEAMIEFERQRVNFGAITNQDRRERFGQYFTFFWRAERRADLTVRFEYRQEKLGSHVQAREFFYPAAKGSYKSQFDIVGEDYLGDGKVTAWRAVMIADGRIVALHQSFLWN